MLDHKQRYLIDAWMHLATDVVTDSYMRFMALWIAFNAYCYAYYAGDANRDRADLRNQRGLASANPEQQPITGSIQRTDNRVVINITTPGPISINVTPKYTEDLIYAALAKEHGETYAQLLTDEHFRNSIEALQHALQKQEGEYYVINMAKIAQHEDNGDLQAMADHNIIVRFNDTTNLRQCKDVLYQIRCNIFHGEKVPGDLNDDLMRAKRVPFARVQRHRAVRFEQVELQWVRYLNERDLATEQQLLCVVEGAKERRVFHGVSARQFVRGLLACHPVREACIKVRFPRTVLAQAPNDATGDPHVKGFAVVHEHVATGEIRRPLETPNDAFHADTCRAEL
jgi:hypothetical protein